VQEGPYFEAYYMGTLHYGQCFKSRDNLGMTSTWIPNKDSTHEFELWSARGMCELLDGGNILIAGDSISQQFFFSLVSSLLAQSFETDSSGTYWNTCENICNWKDECTGPIPINCGSDLKPFTVGFARFETLDELPPNTNPPWARALDDHEISLLILNSGLHYYENSQPVGEGLEGRVHDLLAQLTKSYPDLSIVWRTTPVGHAYCNHFFENAPSSMLTNADVLESSTSSFSSSTSHCASRADGTDSRTAKVMVVDQAQMDAFGWGIISNQSENITQMVRETFPAVFVLDVVPSMRFRSDSHSYDRKQGLDCLHYCLPGPIDSWVEFLYNALRRIRKPKMPTVAASSSSSSSSSTSVSVAVAGGVELASNESARMWTKLYIPQASGEGMVVRPSHYPDVFFLLQDYTRRYIANERFSKILYRIAQEHRGVYSVPNVKDPQNETANIRLLDTIKYDPHFYKIPLGKPYTHGDWHGIVDNYLKDSANFSYLLTCPQLQTRKVSLKDLPPLLSISNIPEMAADLYFGHLTPYQLAPKVIPVMQSRSLQNLMGTGKTGCSSSTTSSAGSGISSIGKSSSSSSSISMILDVELNACAMHCIQPGSVIYVSTDWLPLFFESVYPHVPVPFVLVSGGTDHSTPYRQHLEGYVNPRTVIRKDVDTTNNISHSTSSSTEAHVNTPFSKVLHWYAQNCDGNPNPDHFTCIPLGLSDVTFWTEGKTGFEILASDFADSIASLIGDINTSGASAVDNATQSPNDDRGATNQNNAKTTSNSNNFWNIHNRSRRRLRYITNATGGHDSNNNNNNNNNTSNHNNNNNNNNNTHTRSSIDYVHHIRSKKNSKNGYHSGHLTRRLQQQQSTSTLPAGIEKASSYDVLVPQYNVGTHPHRKIVMDMLCASSALVSPAPEYLYHSQSPDPSPISDSNTDNTTTITTTSEGSGSSSSSSSDKRFISKCLPRVDTIEMYRHTMRSTFVVSPHGNGLDSYRTWETLYLGSWPIVLTSSLDEMYRDLPVLILRDWGDLNKNVLEEARVNFSARAFSYQTLRPAYWARQFHSHYTRDHYQRVHHHSHNHAHELYGSSQSSTRSFSLGPSDTGKEHELEGEVVGFDYARFSVSNNLSQFQSTTTLQGLHLAHNSILKIDNTLFYAILNGTRHRIPGLAQFLKYGWEFSDARLVRETDMNKIQEGPEVK